MSHTTQIIVHVGPTDREHATELAFWIRDHAPRSDTRTTASAGHLAPLTGEIGGEAWGGTKNPTSELWAGTLNHVDLDGILEHLLDIGWDEPDAVQILAKDETDPYYRLYMIRDGSITQHAPAPPLDQQQLPW